MHPTLPTWLAVTMLVTLINAAWSAQAGRPEKHGVSVSQSYFYEQSRLQTDPAGDVVAFFPRSCVDSGRR
jgi:hypothetical protein